MLHHSKIPQVIEAKDAKGAPVVFSMLYVKKSSGELMSVDKAQCTSSNFSPRTYNIKLENGGFRTVCHNGVIRINSHEIYR
jgi:hypothetical protein